GDVDGVRLGIFPDLGIFASALRGGARWKLFSVICARTPCPQASLCFSFGSDRCCGAVLFPPTGRLDRFPGGNSYRPAIPGTGCGTDRAAYPATGTAATVPDVAVSSPRAAGNSRFCLYVGHAQGCTTSDSLRGGHFGSGDSDLCGPSMAQQRVAVWKAVDGR